MVKIRTCTVNEFISKVKSNKMVCFCAGKKFIELCEKYSLQEYVSFIVDNYQKGKEILVNDTMISIKGMEALGERSKKAVWVISSLRYADEIIEQLDKIPICDNVDVYVYEFLKLDQDDVVFATNTPAVIPKKIHYCWFGKNKMPKQFTDNIETWKRHCPDYEIIQWNEDNYDITKNDYMRQAYEAKMWGFVPDYARLDIINTHGGIYLDTDVELLKSLDQLLVYDFFCGFENINWVALGLGFGARKGNRIIKEMLHDYVSRQFINQDGTYNLVASPVYQTQVFERHGLIKNGYAQMLDNGVVLSPEFLAPINSMGLGMPTANSFSIHQYAATWLNEEQLKDKELLIQKCKYVKNRMEG